MWPLADYWSVSEYALPIACGIPGACLGVDRTVVVKTNTFRDPAEQISTQQCSPAYKGSLCSQCSTSYYQLNGRCYPCGGSDSDESAGLTLTLFAAVAFLSLLAVGIAVLRPLQLAHAVSFFLGLQSIALVGVAGSASIPFSTQRFSSFFLWLNLVSLAKHHTAAVLCSQTPVGMKEKRGSEYHSLCLHMFPPHCFALVHGSHPR